MTLAGGLVAAGVEVRAVCATRAVAARLEGAGATATVVPLRHQLDAAGARRVRRALAGVDVVHAPGPPRRAVGPPAAARGRGGVFTVHGLPEPYLPPPAGPERRRACARGSPTGASTRCSPAAPTP